MIYYYKQIHNNGLNIDYTTSEKMAGLEGMNLTTTEAPVKAYNGLYYLRSDAPAKPPETTEEKVTRLESEYDMNRWQREAILAEGSPYSTYTKNKAQEIETLADELRNSK